MNQPKSLFEIASEIARASTPRPTIVDKLLDIRQCKRCGFVECLCGNPTFEEWITKRESNS
jgi:hypothetical protein